jgi:transposase
MLLKTMLNRVAPQKSVVYGKVTLVSKGKQLALAVEIQPRRSSRAVCSGCHRKQPGYDRLSTRRFEFVGPIRNSAPVLSRTPAPFTGSRAC